MMDAVLRARQPQAATAAALAALGREGAASCVGNLADVAPFQLLAWLLETSSFTQVPPSSMHTVPSMVHVPVLTEIRRGCELCRGFWAETLRSAKPWQNPVAIHQVAKRVTPYRSYKWQHCHVGWGRCVRPIFTRGGIDRTRTAARLKMHNDADLRLLALRHC